MYIKNGEKTFDDIRKFIDSQDNIGLVLFDGNYHTLIKIKSDAGYIAIYKSFSYGYEEVINTESISCLCVIDKNKKVLLITNYKFEIKDFFSDYKVFCNTKVILDHYNEAFKLYIENHEKEIISSYQQKNTITIDEACDYLYKQGSFKHKEFIPFISMHSVIRTFNKSKYTLENVDNLIKALTDKNFVKKSIEYIFKADREKMFVELYLKIKDINKAFDEIKAKGNLEVLKRINIIAAVNVFKENNNNIKALTLLTKNNVKCKIMPLILFQGINCLPVFKAVIGGRYISIDDAIKITYGKKVIYQE